MRQIDLKSLVQRVSNSSALKGANFKIGENFTPHSRQAIAFKMKDQEVYDTVNDKKLKLSPPDLVLDGVDF